MHPSLEAELEHWLAPQERLEALRQRWAFPARRDLCDLAYANCYDGPPPEALAALREALAGERALQLQYTPFGGATLARRAAAAELARTHGAPFAWRDVVLTPGAMAALHLVFRALRARPEGDEVVVVTPCWLDTPLYLAQLGMRPLPVPLARETHRLDLDRLAAALGPRTRAVVLCQPVNPTGTLFEEAELAALAALLTGAGERRGEPLWLISDECHRDYVFPPAEFVSPLRRYPWTVVVYSFGKRLSMQGQRLGYAAVPPGVPEREALAGRLERLCRALGFCTPTALMQRALPRLLAVRPDLARLQARRERALAALEGAGYRVVASRATFFLYPRTPRGDDFEFAEELARRGVLVMPAPCFHDEGHFRLALTATDAMLDRALGVLADLR